MKKFILLLAALFLFPLKDLHTKGFFYEVAGSGAKIYLMGSIHMAKQNAFPLDSVIEKAFESCDNLVLEINLNNINPTEILQYGMFQDTTKLEDIVPQKYFKILDSLFSLYSFPKVIYNKLKPWVAVLLLVSLQMTQASDEFIPGVEIYFLNKIKSTQRVLELESFKKQIDVFQSLYNLNPDDFFEYFLMKKDSMDIQFEQLYEAWLKGDENAVQYLMEQEFDDFELSKKYQEILLEQRNQDMTNKIEEFLGQKGCYFVVVGAGHLIGEIGIVKLLRKKGYVVNRLL